MATREVTIPRAVLGPTTAPGLPRSRKSRGPGLLALVLVNLLAAGFLGGAFGALAVFPIIERGLFEQRLHEAKLATQLVAERLARLDEAALTPEAVAAATSRLMVDTQMVRWWSNVGPGPEPLTSALRWTPGADELRMTGRAMQSGQPQSRIAGPASTFGLSHPQAERVAQVAVLVTGRIGARGEAGVVIAEFSLESVEALVRRIFRSVAAVFAVAWFLVLALAIWLLSRSVAAPLAAIASTARAVTGGDSSRRASLRGPREVGEVAEALNVMLDAEAAQLERRERQVADLIRANRDLREARAEVLRGETLASLGRLASGVAHEIGNPLGAIIGYTDLLRDDRLTPAERNDYLDRMQGDLGRIRATIRQLLDLARPSSGEASAIDVV
jgi:methyl-accepting chemotaxis protein